MYIFLTLYIQNVTKIYRYMSYNKKVTMEREGPNLLIEHKGNITQYGNKGETNFKVNLTPVSLSLNLIHTLD